MAYARSTRNAFGGPRDAGEGAVRLVYILSTAGRSQGFHLLPTRKRGEAPLEETEFKALFDRLHPLDLEIARELRSAQAYGFLSDGQVARLLPLLTRRRTFMEGERIRNSDIKLYPRARAEANEQGRMELCLGFMDEDGDWFDPAEGKVVAGTQAFWIRNCRCFEIESAQPWQMARTKRWANAARKEAETRNGLTPMSINLETALGASLVCKVLKTICPVREALIAISAVSRSRISPTITIFGACRNMARKAAVKVIPTSVRTCT